MIPVNDPRDCWNAIMPADPPPDPETFTMALTGDVMLGRGIDQVLPHPNDPVLYERFVGSARDYVAMAERVNGPIPAPVPFDYVWGDLLAELAAAPPDVLLINLETSVTTHPEPAPKGINYRMHPGNVGVLTALRPDVCGLANNHVLDWGVAGLSETLSTLASEGLVTVGAGRTEDEAWAPAVVTVPGKGRVLVLAVAVPSSGVPLAWAAGPNRPGIAVLPDLSPAGVDRIAAALAGARRPGDRAVLSIHWGPNWGYGIDRAEQRFAEALVDRAGVNVVHGHSSHHPKAVGRHRGRPIVYGCGDLLNDYEGIGGEVAFRGDLVLLYRLGIDLASGRCRTVDMVPFRLRRFRLERAAPADRAWLAERMDRECRRFGGRVTETADRLRLVWNGG